MAAATWSERTFSLYWLAGVLSGSIAVNPAPENTHSARRASSSLTIFLTQQLNTLVVLRQASGCSKNCRVATITSSSWPGFVFAESSLALDTLAH